METDGSYTQVTPDDEPVRDVQEILMNATKAALDRGNGPGMVIDTDLIEEELLIGDEAATEVEDVTAGQPSAEHGETSDSVDAGDAEQPRSDDETASIFDTCSEHWYRPDSQQYEWVVRTTDGKRRYFKTREGARSRLRSEYE
jgi:polyphosphate kinase